MRYDASAVIFDSDGVLVDSHLDGFEAWTQLGTEFGFELDDDGWAQVTGVRPADSLAALVEPERHDAAVARLEDLEVALASPTTPLPGARQLLAGLPPSKWAIATSAGTRLAHARWNGAELTVPDIVVAGEDVTEGKPSPQPYLAAAERLGVDIGDCIVFEDSPAGARSADAAGARVIAVGRQPWDIEPLRRVRNLGQVSITPINGGRLRVVVSG